MKLIDGGIRMPSVPPAASVPRKSDSSYLRIFTCGRATTPTVAAVATLEPEVAANIAQVPMLACISPPGSHDSQVAIAA